MSIETTDLTSQTPTSNSLLTRADMFLKNKDYVNAEAYYNKVLDINPYTSRAYWGLLLCKISYVNFETITEKPQSITSYIEYKTAIEYAESNEIAKKYISNAEKMQARFDSLWATRTVKIKEELTDKIQKSKKTAKTFKILRTLSIIAPCFLTALIFLIPIIIVIANGGFMMHGATAGRSSPLPMLIMSPVFNSFIFGPWIAGFSIVETLVNKSISSKEAKINSLDNQGDKL